MSSNGSPYDEVSSAQVTLNRINSYLYEQERDKQLKNKKRFYCDHCGEKPFLNDKNHKRLCGKIKCKNPYCKGTLSGAKEIEKRYCEDCQKSICKFYGSLKNVDAILDYNENYCSSIRRKITLCTDCGKLTVQFPKIKSSVGGQK